MLFWAKLGYDNEMHDFHFVVVDQISCVQALSESVSAQLLVMQNCWSYPAPRYYITQLAGFHTVLLIYFFLANYFIKSLLVLNFLGSAMSGY
jgi:hypothetical protein